ncbi:LysR substrate-binding domain-containing protein [Phenylobacterium sp.]|uniref:LysR substrate-binding domain-containing protein n=1 Tax=Phenylobacterium sp. TaxID=1871053 RepID=UPI0025F1F12A|nr:LysR substrate-binding domain-containing protein [Phenylobacterium sp.]
MTVNHQHLRAFHAIAVEGSFSRAARRLNVAQPTLSQQIKALENRHQAALFQGRRPPLRLTSMGQDLFALTKRMFATSDEIDELLGGEAEAGPRSIRLGSDSPIYAARLAKAVMASHPEAAIEVRIDNARETMRRLQEASVDVVVSSDPPMDGQFFYEPLFADYLMVAVPSSHSRAKDGLINIEALAHEPLLIREPASKTRAAMEMLLATANVAPDCLIELHSREAIREAIALGMGVSLFFSSECPPDARLAFLRPTPQAERAQLIGYVVCRVERRRTALMRAVFAAAETLKPLSPLPLPGLSHPVEAAPLVARAAALAAVRSRPGRRSHAERRRGPEGGAAQQT